MFEVKLLVVVIELIVVKLIVVELIVVELIVVELIVIELIVIELLIIKIKLLVIEIKLLVIEIKLLVIEVKLFVIEVKLFNNVKLPNQLNQLSKFSRLLRLSFDTSIDMQSCRQSTWNYTELTEQCFSTGVGDGATSSRRCRMDCGSNSSCRFMPGAMSFQTIGSSADTRRMWLEEPQLPA